jgi:hypothetical protein
MSVRSLDVDAFRRSLSRLHPPEELDVALQALWWDAKGDWGKAHECAQARDDAAGMRVHAYLHRKEGDLGNAGYWYRRCGARPANGSLDIEWEELVEAYLASADQP